MALQINKTVDNLGITLPASYARIETFQGDKNTTIASVVVYSDINARNSGKDPMEQFTFSISTPTTDLLPALYTYLKTLPEFAGAADV